MKGSVQSDRSAASAVLRLGFVDRLLPAVAHRAVDAEAFDVRLDVEQRRFVEHVDIGDVKDTTIATE